MPPGPAAAGQLFFIMPFQSLNFSIQTLSSLNFDLSLTVLSYLNFNFWRLPFGAMLEFLVLHPGIHVIVGEDACALRLGLSGFYIFAHLTSSDT